MTILDALVIKNQEELAAFADKLGYIFTDISLLQEAFIHSSYAFEQGNDLQRDNETLEFLGDAVLDLAVAHGLYRHFPEMKEGELSQLRASLVNESHLARMARQMDMGPSLLLGRGEDHSQGRTKDSILSCAFEAVMGAVFLDGGYGAAEKVVARLVVPWFDERRQALDVADAKSRLQAMLQEIFSEGPVYHLEEATGPDHDKTFRVSVRFREQVLAWGEEKNKKKAEQQAAAKVIAKFDSYAFRSSPVVKEE
ncbi:MAG: ribonuclease III [Desulfurivibrionaceae bacterium]|nr:ribonuclease III [Desulfurivibrionaceae bacterium]